MATVRAAEILEQNSHVVPGKLKITEFFFQVPLDHANPSGPTLRIFARGAQNHEVPVDPDDSSASSKKGQHIPWLLYLQGGPGSGCQPPQKFPFTRKFVDKGYQMLYMDQRGTGLSSPISADLLLKAGDAHAQANLLKHFRADNIVRDCEAIRKALMDAYPASKRKWSVIGQSYGGICATTYLSFHPEGLKEVFIAGGLPPLVQQPYEVYVRLWRKVLERNKAYYDKFPEDIERLRRIAQFLHKTKPDMPSGGVLTVERFLFMGLFFGFHGGLDDVHAMVLRVWNEMQNNGFLTCQTKDALYQFNNMDGRLIYSLLHEPLYCQGKASNWAAARAMKQYPEFDLRNRGSGQPLMFTGEMILPFMFEAYGELRKLKDVAHILAAISDWPNLYDIEQLRKNEVPVYAAVYIDDMYVDVGFSQETATTIKGTKTFVTNIYYHDSVRSKMEEIVETFWQLRCDTID